MKELLILVSVLLGALTVLVLLDALLVWLVCKLREKREDG